MRTVLSPRNVASLRPRTPSLPRAVPVPDSRGTPACSLRLRARARTASSQARAGNVAGTDARAGTPGAGSSRDSRDPAVPGEAGVPKGEARSRKSPEFRPQFTFRNYGPEFVFTCAREVLRRFNEARSHEKRLPTCERKRPAPGLENRDGPFKDVRMSADVANHVGRHGACDGCGGGNAGDHGNRDPGRDRPGCGG